MNLISSPLVSLFNHLAPLCCAACDTRYHLKRGELSPIAKAFCLGCAPLLEPLPYAESCFAYGGPLADAIRRLKYGNRPDLGRRLGTLLVPRATLRFQGKVDAVVPIPLSPWWTRRRGYNQSALLAGPIARALGIKCKTRLMHRVDKGASQVRRDRRERRNLSASSFSTRGHLPSRLLIVDDVKTTGATASAARSALLHAGARSVYFLSLAGPELEPSRAE